jgi:hypothetical protein
METFKELFESKEEDFDSPLEYDLDLISIIHDIDVYDDEFDELGVDEFDEYLDSIKFVKYTEPNKEINKHLFDMRFKEYNTLTLKEYIELDYFFQVGYIDNFETICSILYKKYKIDDFGTEILEPYNYDLDKRSEMFKYVLIDDVYGIIPSFIKYKTEMAKSYNWKDLDEDELDEDDTESLTGLDKILYEKEKKKEQDRQLFSWEILLHKLSNGDLTKQNEILNMPHIRVFNYLNTLKLV